MDVSGLPEPEKQISLIPAWCPLASAAGYSPVLSDKD